MKKLFKSLFYSIVLGLAVMVSFTSCDKDDDDSAASKALLMNKTWEVKSFKSEQNGAAFEAAIATEASQVQIDFIFSVANVYTVTFETYGIKVPMPGTWSMSNDAKTLTLDGEMATTIEKLTETDLEVSFTKEDFQTSFNFEFPEIETGRIIVVMKAK